MNSTDKKSVFVKNTTPKSLKEDVLDVLKETYVINVKSQNRTLIKINGNHDVEYPGSDTSSWFLDALLYSLRKLDFEEIVVIEGDGYLYSAEKMIRNTGLLTICNKYDVPFKSYENLERDENDLPSILKDSQLINVPVFHTHGFAIISCATKNLFGLLPKSRWKYHDCLEEKLIDLYNKVKPVYTIVDGTVGLKGDSTRRGDPVQLDLITAGWDTLCVDLIAAKIMGYTIDKIPLLKYAKEENILNEDLYVIGDYDLENLPTYDFRFSYSGPKKFSMWLHNHKMSKIIIESWLVNIIFHKFRGMYEMYTFHKKKKEIFSGPWMDYKKRM
jgi:uncharacterized protein (DUF362 family)